MIITIDGPTASGKSTLARNLAAKLNYYYLNSGFLYRGLAYALAKYFSYDEQKLKEPDLKDIENVMNKLDYVYDGKNSIIIYDKEDITPNLKTPEIDKYSSIISSNPNVRDVLHAYQREMAKKHNLIAEGRDCGSVLFPNAELKIFLTAAPEIRAARWQKEMAKRDIYFSLQESIKKISERDNKDEQRTVSPLIIPKNAIVIDDSNIDKEKLLNKVLDLLRDLK